MMAAVWMRVRHDLRIRWRGALALAVLLGLGGTVAMTAAAGARRTSSAYDRLLASSNGYDADVQVIGDAAPDILERVAALPEVAEFGRFATFAATKGTPDRPAAPFRWDLAVGAIVDPALGTSFEKPQVISGRLADYRDAGQAMVSEAFVQEWDRGAGDDFAVQLVRNEELDEFFSGRFPTPTGPLVTVRIVGVVRLPHDSSIFEPAGNMYLTPAFFEQYEDQAAQFSGLYIRLRDPDRGFPAFRRNVDALAGPGVLEVQPADFFAAKVDRALGVQTIALWLLAGVVGAGAALVLGQSVGRWLTMGADEYPALRALGMGARQLIALTGVSAAVIGIGAGTIAMAGCLLGSLLMPVGLARSVEPDPGLSADGSVLAVGGVALAGFIVLVGAVQGVVLSRRSRMSAEARGAPTSRTAELAARSGMPPTVVSGVRLALEPGRGRTAVPVRTALAGASLSVLVLVAVFVFGTSLDRMFATPATYGWNWDVLTFGGDDPELAAGYENQLRASPIVTEFSRVRSASIRFDGRDIQAASFAPVKGSILPTVLEGRFPRSANEVALATKTMRLARLRIGDSATFDVSREEGCEQENPECRVRLRVVGRIVAWGENADSDEGAGFAESGLARIAAGGFNFHDYAVRFPPNIGVSAGYRALKREFPEVGLPNLPPNLKNVSRIRSAPTALGVILACFALATIVHVLVTAVRRRSRDLAVLKTVGFVRGQVGSAVAWQATVLATVAVIVGVPGGIVAGRWAWGVMADRLGVATVAPAVAGRLAIGSLALLLVANIAALLPGRAAARTQPALILRSE